MGGKNESANNRNDNVGVFHSCYSNIKVTGNAKPEDIDLPETSVAFSRAATG